MSEFDPAYSAVLARCVLRTAGAGLDSRQLLAEAELPETVLSNEYGTVSSRAYLRLWECAEFHQQASEVGLRIAETYRLGCFDIYDYLFATAPTVADGIAAVRRSGATMATNHRYIPEPEGAEPDGEHTTVLHLTDCEGRGADLTVQAAYASTLARIRHATAALVSPARMTLRQSAPRALGPFVEAFGTDRIDFGAPCDSMTLRAADLALPLRTADPVLAGILRRHAEVLATPRLDGVPWPELVQQALATAIGAGDSSLAAVARRLTVSPRTLQRRLAEAGTTWRQELDRARQALARHNRPDSATKSSLAHRLGYSDARALRRAARRWDALPGVIEHATTAGARVPVVSNGRDRVEGGDAHPTQLRASVADCRGSSSCLAT